MAMGKKSQGDLKAGGAPLIHLRQTAQQRRARKKVHWGLRTEAARLGTACQKVETRATHFDSLDGNFKADAAGEGG